MSSSEASDLRELLDLVRGASGNEVDQVLACCRRVLDEPTFSRLIVFVEDVRAGRRPHREPLLAQQPNLQELLDRLQTLLQPLASAPTLVPDPTRPPVASEWGSFSGLLHGSMDFGKYELLEELGRGGMGVVYKARQKDLDRLVAIKMILSSHLASDDQVTRFHAEARAAARLPHRHIVQVFETGQVHGQHFFAMEYVEGQSLERRLAAGPLKPEEAVVLLLPIVRAVAHLHGHGLIHRDLKPANVLLAGDRPVLTDFGLAKALNSDSRLTATGAIVGTPSYMSPEQAAAREVGPATDVYALGAILYECLTGRPPFRGPSPLDTIVQVLELEPTLPRRLNPNVPRPLELICLKCLDKSPEGRYHDANELADDLERFLQGEPVLAQPAGLGERFVRWTRREPALSAHLGAIGFSGLIHDIGYRLTASVPEAVHLAVLGILGAWALLCFLLQRLLGSLRWAGLVPFAWCAVDVLLLTAVLDVSRAIVGPLVVLYPLYITATGLWFQVRLVWFGTILSQIGYVYLYISAQRAGIVLDLPHRHLILLVALGLLGFVVAYQVRRVRLLSRHQGQRST